MSSQPQISLILAVEENENDVTYLIEQMSDPDFCVLPVEAVIIDQDPSIPEGEIRSIPLESQVPWLTIKKWAIHEPSHRSTRRNLAIERATAPLIMFLAGDCHPVKGCLERHVTFHQDHPEKQAIGIGGAFFESSIVNRFMDWADRSGAQFGLPFYEYADEAPLGKYFYGANSSMKLELMKEVGPFDENFPYNATDDYDIGLRLQKLGAKSFYLSGAEVIHHHHVEMAERDISLQESGEGTAYLDLKYGGGPWQEDLNYSLFRLWVARNLYGGLYLLTRKQKQLDRFYAYHQRLTYCRAYQKARKNPPQWVTEASVA